jgi:hypothetical protein
MAGNILTDPIGVCDILRCRRPDSIASNYVQVPVGKLPLCVLHPFILTRFLLSTVSTKKNDGKRHRQRNTF